MYTYTYTRVKKRQTNCCLVPRMSIVILCMLFAFVLGAEARPAQCEEETVLDLNVPLPLSSSATVQEGEEQACPRAQDRSKVRIRLQVSVLGQDSENPAAPCREIALDSNNPAASCREIALCDPNTKSGYYWILSSNGTAIRTYCDMSRTCCNSTGGWSRVAYLNMTDPTHQCPTAWTEITDPVRTCTLTNLTNNYLGCSSAFFSTYGIPYSQVCGSVLGYQRGSPSAFKPYIDSDFTSLEEPYVHGVVINTHGTEKQHIWTFAAALGEAYVWHLHYPTWTCPCTGNSTTIPSFVGENYFCESGVPGNGNSAYSYYSSDQLWDGNNCAGNACCDFNNPPYFCSQLPEATTDDIEIRICGHILSAFRGPYADSPVEMIELYTR